MDRSWQVIRPEGARPQHDRVVGEATAARDELVKLRAKAAQYETAAFEVQSARQRHALFEQQLKDVLTMPYLELQLQKRRRWLK